MSAFVVALACALTLASCGGSASLNNGDGDEEDGGGGTGGSGGGNTQYSEAANKAVSSMVGSWRSDTYPNYLLTITEDGKFTFETSTTKVLTGTYGAGKLTSSGGTGYGVLGGAKGVGTAVAWLSATGVPSLTVSGFEEYRAPDYRHDYRNTAFKSTAVPDNGVVTDSKKAGSLVDWAQQSTPVSGVNLYSIAYGGGGNFVAGGASGIIVYSKDNGVTWTRSSTLPFDGKSVLSVFYLNGVFFAMGSGTGGKFDGSESGESVMAHSRDGGVTWLKSDKMLVAKSKATGMAYSTELDMLIAVGFDGSNYTNLTGHGQIRYSTNGGATWGNAKDGYADYDSQWRIDTPFYDVAYGKDKFVAVGMSANLEQPPYHARIEWSTDGKNWKYINPSSFLGNNSVAITVAYGNGKFVLGCHDGSVAFSEDGITWAKTSFTGNLLTKISYGGGKFFAVTYNGEFWHSENGMSWTKTANNSFGGTRINAAAYGNGVVVAVGDNGKIGVSK